MVSFNCIHQLFIISIVVLVVLRSSLAGVEAQRRNLATTGGPHQEFAMVVVVPTPGTPRFFGGGASISVWQPAVSRIKDFSSSSIQIILDDDAFLEAGWIVYPKRYGDFKPRLFVYWTNDNSKDTGCFDLDCEGFKLFTGVTSTLGQPIVPVSVEGASTFSVIDILIFQDKSTGDWQLNIGGTPTGKWPAFLFTATHGAQEIAWGGAVFDSEGSKEHTSTDMGNGLFPDVTTQHASLVCSLQYVDASFTLRSPDRDMLRLSVTKSLCYDAMLLPVTDTEHGVCFLFGGSGRNPSCP